MIFPDRSYLKDPTSDLDKIDSGSWQYYATPSIMRESLWSDTNFETLSETAEYKIFSYFRTALNQELILISKDRPYLLAIQYRSFSKEEALRRLLQIQSSIEIQ